jgi:hypothetical protein
LPNNKTDELCMFRHEQFSGLKSKQSIGLKTLPYVPLKSMTETENYRHRKRCLNIIIVNSTAI